MVSKAFPFAILKCASIFISREIEKALKNEKLVEEFKTKLVEYGRNIHEEYLRKREEVFELLPYDSLREGLEELLNSIDDKIICHGKEDINPNLPANTLECIIGAYVKMAILDATHSFIKEGDYNKAMKDISYLSIVIGSGKIVKAFRNMYLHEFLKAKKDISETITIYELARYELGGYITDILEAKKDISETIKELDRAFKYAYNYIVETIKDLFYNREERFLKKIEDGIQLDPYKKVRH